MICGNCGKPMIIGEFRMEQRSVDKGYYRAYPVAAFYQENVKLCETPLDKTLGFYCAECGMLAGFSGIQNPLISPEDSKPIWILLLTSCRRKNVLNVRLKWILIIHAVQIADLFLKQNEFIY